MPTIRYMSWNIQNLGQATEQSNAARGANASQFASFLAEMVQIKNIDILAVMEVRPGAGAYLDSILLALNNADPAHPWYYDYIRSTVNVQQGQPVATNNDLGWASGARTEGYAIFWRTIPSFAMQASATNTSEGTIHQAGNPALAFNSCLSLSQVGRQLQATVLAPTNGYVPATPGNSNWGPSLYPSAQNTLSAAPRWMGSRRPATCTIQINSGTNPLCTISVYHAPSKSPRSYIGTYIAGLAREVYAVPNGGGGLTALGNTINSGDYNASVNSYWLDYASFYYPFANNSDGGANCSYVYDDTNPVQTTVQLNTFQNGIFNGPPIAGANDDDYYFSPIDNIFFRTTGNNQEWIYDLIGAVQAGGSLVGGPIQSYYMYLQGLVANATAQGYGLTGGCPNDSQGNPLFPNITNWANFVNDVNAGTFTSARRAAEFVRIFLSDHVPLVLELTYP